MPSPVAMEVAHDWRRWSGATTLSVPLDDRRHWYRYHHLFADVLSAHLTAEQPDLVPKLHRCASEWYQHHGSAADAIHHALAAGDFERAADLIEPALRELRRARQEPTILGWLRAIPVRCFIAGPSSARCRRCTAV